jgi:murein DD-endopeptidase MepM/ murein hydrolase activator NlpD
MMVRPVFHVDHDPVEHPEAPARCTNYAGQPFPACYDGHTGSDFMLGGGFATMDTDSAPVVAAAGGVVEVAEDGHYDRCRGDVTTLEVTCDGHEMRANFVRLRHANGWSTLYYHLKKGSVAVTPGQRVACGDLLGLVGSSGRSTLPHLHFQVEDPVGTVVDPFAPDDAPEASLFVEQTATDGRPGGACDALWARAPDVP